MDLRCIAGTFFKSHATIVVTASSIADFWSHSLLVPMLVGFLLSETRDWSLACIALCFFSKFHLSNKLLALIQDTYGFAVEKGDDILNGILIHLGKVFFSHIADMGREEHIVQSPN